MAAVGADLEVRVGAVMFTDLVGFTEFNDVAGDVAAVGALDTQTEILGDLLVEHPDARLVKELGDGLMVWFGVAREALSCAIAFLERVNAARRADAFPLAVRLGVHHGEAVARGDDLVGRTVNIAARVADLAGPSELLVSEHVLRASGEDRLPDRFQPVGPASVRGVKEPIWLHRYRL